VLKGSKWPEKMLGTAFWPEYKERDAEKEEAWLRYFKKYRFDTGSLFDRYQFIFDPNSPLFPFKERESGCSK